MSDEAEATPEQETTMRLPVGGKCPMCGIESRRETTYRWAGAAKQPDKEATVKCRTIHHYGMDGCVLIWTCLSCEGNWYDPEDQAAIDASDVERKRRELVAGVKKRALAGIDNTLSFMRDFRADIEKL